MKSIAFFDLETTGVDTQVDRIVQIAIQVYDENYNLVEKFKSLVNPLMPIPKVASDIHGITDEMVKDAPRLFQIANEIHKHLSVLVINGFNIKRFDVPLLMTELDRIGFPFDFTNKIIVDTYELHNALNPRTLGAIYEKYMGKPMEDAHDADVDVTATKDVFLKLIDKHSLEGISFHDIRQFANNNKPVVDIEGKFTVNEDGDFAFNFGKHGGKNVLDNRDYLSWMLNGNFSSDVKGWCQKFINM